jgi:hypothetical protein
MILILKPCKIKTSCADSYIIIHDKNPKCRNSWVQTQSTWGKYEKNVKIFTLMGRTIVGATPVCPTGRVNKHGCESECIHVQLDKKYMLANYYKENITVTTTMFAL